MNISILKYCDTHNNELSRLLRLFVESGVFCNQDNLSIRRSNSVYIVEIKILCSLNAIDFRYIVRFVGERYWIIRPNYCPAVPSFSFLIQLLKTDL